MRNYVRGVYADRIEWGLLARARTSASGVHSLIPTGRVPSENSNSICRNATHARAHTLSAESGPRMLRCERAEARTWQIQMAQLHRVATGRGGRAAAEGGEPQTADTGRAEDRAVGAQRGSPTSVSLE
jgi:hypothetical protein